MIRKLSLAAAIAILAASMSGGWAFAQGKNSNEAPSIQPPSQNGRGLLAQVTEIEEDHFTAQDPKGELHTITITAETTFRKRQDQTGQPASYEDLQTGLWVLVANRKAPGKQAEARLVILLPADFDPASIKGLRVMGEVQKINNGQNTFDLTTRRGDMLTFSVDDSTRFAGSISELKDLEKGMQVGVVAVKQEDGTLLTKLVADEKPDPPKLGRKNGRITAIGDSSLTITTRQDETLTVNITENTRFGSRDGSLNSLDDLALEDAVVVIYKQTDAETPDAAGVIYVDEASLKIERNHGEVQSAGGSHLTLNTAEDEKLTFTVDENTHLRGRGVEDLNDIKNGMKAMVLYVKQEDGTLLAKGIIVHTGEKPPKP